MPIPTQLLEDEHDKKSTNIMKAKEWPIPVQSSKDEQTQSINFIKAKKLPILA